MYIGLYVKYSLFFWDVSEPEFLERISENAQI